MHLCLVFWQGRVVNEERQRSGQNSTVVAEDKESPLPHPVSRRKAPSHSPQQVHLRVEMELIFRIGFPPCPQDAKTVELSS